MLDVRPWLLLGSLLAALSGCDKPTNDSAAASASSEVPAPPGPHIAIGETNVLLDGVELDVTRRIDEVGRVQKVDKLFDALRKARSEGKATASIRMAPKTSGVVFASVFQTATYAGFSPIAVLIGDRYLTFEGAVSHPCAMDPGGSECDDYVASPE